MFSLVGKKTVQRNNEAAIELWCFSPSFSLKLHQLAHCTAFFHVALAFKLQWKHTLKSYIHPCWYVVATRHTAMFWTCVIWWLMLTLSALCLIYLLFYWTIGNRKDCRNSDSGCQYCASMMQRESHTSCRPVLLCPLALWWFICQ